jgi:hypothetical protein
LLSCHTFLNLVAAAVRSSIECTGNTSCAHTVREIAAEPNGLLLPNSCVYVCVCVSQQYIHTYIRARTVCDTHTPIYYTARISREHT